MVGLPVNKTTLKCNIKLSLTLTGHHLVPWWPASLPICKMPRHSQCPLCEWDRAAHPGWQPVCGWWVVMGHVQPTGQLPRGLVQPAQLSLGLVPWASCTSSQDSIQDRLLPPPSLYTLSETRMTCWLFLGFYAAYSLPDLGQLLDHNRPQFPHL